MPFLRYFVVVGLGLLGLLFASNYWLATPAPVAVSNASDEPVKDALYYWRQTEARNHAPVNHQFTVIPQTAIAMGKGIAVPPDSVVQAQASTTNASTMTQQADATASAATSMAGTDKIAMQKPNKVRRTVAQRAPSSVEQQQAYQQQQDWQQQRFRQANAQANAGGPFGLFSGVWR
jgi:hypothetical protein